MHAKDDMSALWFVCAMRSAPSAFLLGSASGGNRDEVDCDLPQTRLILPLGRGFQRGSADYAKAKQQASALSYPYFPPFLELGRHGSLSFKLLSVSFHTSARLNLFCSRVHVFSRTRFLM